MTQNWPGATPWMGVVEWITKVSSEVCSRVPGMYSGVWRILKVMSVLCTGIVSQWMSWMGKEDL